MTTGSACGPRRLPATLSTHQTVAVRQDCSSRSSTLCQRSNACRRVKCASRQTHSQWPRRRSAGRCEQVTRLRLPASHRSERPRSLMCDLYAELRHLDYSPLLGFASRSATCPRSPYSIFHRIRSDHVEAFQLKGTRFSQPTRRTGERREKVHVSNIRRTYRTIIYPP
jgi:hypothetical protein